MSVTTRSVCYVDVLSQVAGHADRRERRLASPLWVRRTLEGAHVSYAEKLLDDVRAQLALDDVVLKEARERRELIRGAASVFPRVLRTYRSGSLAHGTANCPVHQRDKGLDADCGAVLDRRHYRDLGPNGLGVDPKTVVGAMVRHLSGRVREEYPAATLRITKRDPRGVPPAAAQW